MIDCCACLLPLPGFEACLGHVRKLTVIWGWAVVFLGFSPNMAENVTIIKIPSSSFIRAQWMTQQFQQDIFLYLLLFLIYGYMTPLKKEIQIKYSFTKEIFIDWFTKYLCDIQ